jgi:hypothetical protein
MKQIVAIILVIFSSNAIAQSHDNVWVMGYPYGQYSGFPSFDFYYNKPDTFSCKIPFGFGNTYSEISDSKGNLKLIGNGVTIFNWNYQQVDNSFDYNSDVDLVNQFAHIEQDAEIILPKPNRLNQYSIFSLGAVNNGSQRFSKELRYSEIDMNLNGGLGQMTIKKQFIISNDTLSFGTMAACLDADGENWWVINKTINSNKFSIVKLDSNGASLIKSIRTGYNVSMNWVNFSLFAPSCKYYCSIGDGGLIDLYAFDNSTGDFSFFKQLKIHSAIDSNYNYARYAAFSNNGLVLYVSNGIELFQFDLQSKNIQKSEQIVATYDGFVDFNPCYFAAMLLAPDNKIYVNATATRFMGVVNNPNVIGIGCNVQQHSIMLPSYSDYFLPNFPYFRKYNLSTIVESVAEKLDLKIYPNPTKDELNVEIPSGLSISKVVIENMLGQAIQIFSTSNRTNIRIDLSSTTNGIYFLKIIDDKGLQHVEKFVKE